VPIPPWEDRRCQIDPAEFQRVVSALLAEAGRGLAEFRVEQRELIRTPDGNYRIKDVQILSDKLRAAGAQKGMLFSTNGFQKGAIEYARSHGIALVRVIEGALTYETRGLNTQAHPAPPWANFPKYVGHLVSLSDDGRWHVSLVETGRVDALRGFLASV
jgi:restriction system protein